MSIETDTGFITVTPVMLQKCSDCGRVFGKSETKWELEDGREVCNECCVTDTRLLIGKLKDEMKKLLDSHNKNA